MSGWRDANAPRLRGLRPTPVSSTVEVGDAAPDFTLPNERGVDVPLRALRDGPVVVVFGRASAQFDLARALADARRELGAVGAVALFVVAGDRDVAAEVASDTGRDLVVLADREGEVHRAYGVVDMLAQGPRVALFVIDGNGDVAAVHSLPDPARAVPTAIHALDLAR